MKVFGSIENNVAGHLIVLHMTNIEISCVKVGLVGKMQRTLKRELKST